MSKEQVKVFVDALSRDSRIGKILFQSMCRMARFGGMGFGKTYIDYGSVDYSKG